MYLLFVPIKMTLHLARFYKNAESGIHVILSKIAFRQEQKNSIQLIIGERERGERERGRGREGEREKIRLSTSPFG